MQALVKLVRALATQKAARLGFMAIIGLIAVSCEPLAPTPAPPELSALSFEELKGKASSPTYDDLFRNNEPHIGKLVYYQAQVIQVIDAGKDRYQLRANVTRGQFLWEDTIFLRYVGSRFLDNDVIEFVGTVVGLTTYKSVLGGPITIPDVSIVKAKLVSKAGGTNGGTLTTPAPSPLPTSQPNASTLTTPTSTLVPVPTPTPTPTGPRTSFSDGVWIIGVDIAPGTYRNSNPSGTCYWKRLKGLGGTIGEVIASELSPYTQTVSISPSDAGFDSSRCGTWSRIAQ